MAIIAVRATVHLTGVGPGRVVWADEDDPQIARWLRGQQLIRVDPDTGKDVPTKKPRRRRSASE